MSLHEPIFGSYTHMALDKEYATKQKGNLAW